jgi:hypothetical protein
MSDAARARLAAEFAGEPAALSALLGEAIPPW